MFWNKFFWEIIQYDSHQGASSRLEKARLYLHSEKNALKYYQKTNILRRFYLLLA